MTGLLLALALDAGLVQEAVEVFTPALEVFLAANERSRAYADYLGEMGREDARMELSDALESLDILGNRFYFDADGDLWFDDRFVRPDERPAIEAAGRFFREHFADALKSRAEPRALPAFRGYEDARYQLNDGLVARVVGEFNTHRGEWAAATPEQARGIGELHPALVKSLMLEEYGGRAPEDGDDFEGEARAAVERLVRLGFDASGGPASERPESRFRGWYEALERYDGRGGEGRVRRGEFAWRVARRAFEPKSFVPVGAPGAGRAAR